MSIQDYTWDFFISYASPDKAVADQLYDLLAPSCKVYLNTHALSPGENWFQKLPQELSKSRITIVLISPHTGDTHFQNEEILMAIKIMRANRNKHYIVPVILSPDQIGSEDFGLQGLNALYLQDLSALQNEVVEPLRKLLGEMKRTSWQDYEGLFNVNDGYRVAYLSLI